MVTLRAVYDDGKQHSEGTVRGMWSSGIVLATDVRIGIGTPLALIVLSGGFDGARLAAEVAGVEKDALLLLLPDLDSARWTRLRALIEGKPLAGTMPSTPLIRTPPPNVAAFIISGGEDDLGDPTGVILLGESDQKQPGAPAPIPLLLANPALQQQVHALAAENAALKAELQRVMVLKAALEDELKGAQAKLDDIDGVLRRS